MYIVPTRRTAAELKKYLDDEWYEGNGEGDVYWYDNHLITDDEIFFGYWSFESAAVAKIMGLDESISKDQQYYPYDPVHW